MNRPATYAMIALSAFGFAMTSLQTSAEAGHRSRALAIGLGTLAVATIVASSDRRYSTAPRMTCGQLLDRCYAGSDWACDRFDYRCR